MTDVASLPPALRDTVAADLQALGAALEPVPQAVRQMLPRVLAASRFVARNLTREPQRLAEWSSAGLFDPDGGTALPGALARAMRACASDGDARRVLREARTQAMTRIAFRALAGWADLDETLCELSVFADAASDGALRWAAAALQRRAGIPRDSAGDTVEPFVLGMGKLGGGELNFSSDIDLIFGFEAAGQTDGPRPMANDAYFARLAQDFTQFLAARTEHGFVYRVDWALRPFGLSGPPAMHSDAIEDYYQSHGREWERYALIKARPVAGDLDAGHRLLHALRPFVYRRYLDFNAIANLRDMKRRIEEDVQRKDMADNIKLGAGGIRELEFIVQVFQLVRGGQERPLRDARLRPVLAYLGQAGHLDAATAARLAAAYDFLRRLENAVQMYADEQTHALPATPAARAALCVAMELPDWDTLDQRLRATREFVHAEFERLFDTPPRSRESPLERAVAAIWRDSKDPDQAAEALCEHGYGRHAAAVVEALAELRQARLVRELSEAAAQRLAALLPKLLVDSVQTGTPDAAALRALKVVQAVAGRATYISLLLESSTAREQLVRVCAASPWISDLIAASPVLLDQLLDPRALYDPPDRDAMRVELQARYADLAPGDTEAAMDALRRFRQEVTLRVAAADRVGGLPLVKVSDRLTWLAEVVVQQALDSVWAEMCAHYGTPRRGDGAPAGFAVVGYGKLGGIEMGYGSDLDLVFLHDCDALEAETAGGDRPVTAGVWMARLAQRLINWLSTQTGAGRAYEVDLELRPSGKSGLMVTRIDAFATYQRETAWTWEHQALSRARAVAGTPAIREAFEDIRRDVLCAGRDLQVLRKDIVDMRARMRAHREARHPGLFDVKQGEGGLTDIEFLTQYLVLTHARAHPELVRWSDNWRQTEDLVAAGVLPQAQAETLIDCYRVYRDFVHAQALSQVEALAEEGRFDAQRAAVCGLWKTYLGGDA